MNRAFVRIEIYHIYPSQRCSGMQKGGEIKRRPANINTDSRPQKSPCRAPFVYHVYRDENGLLCAYRERKVQERGAERRETLDKQQENPDMKEDHLLRAFLSRNAPTAPAATATPPIIATPTRPSRVTRSSMRVCRFEAWRFAGSLSRRMSLYRLASL